MRTHHFLFVFHASGPHAIAVGGSDDGHTSAIESHSIIQEVGIENGQAAVLLTAVEKEGRNEDGTEGDYDSSAVPEDAPGLNQTARATDTPVDTQTE